MSKSRGRDFRFSCPEDLILRIGTEYGSRPLPKGMRRLPASASQPEAAYDPTWKSNGGAGLAYLGVRVRTSYFCRIEGCALDRGDLGYPELRADTDLNQMFDLSSTDASMSRPCHAAQLQDKTG
jgi:hypothetical protein